MKLLKLSMGLTLAFSSFTFFAAEAIAAYQLLSERRPSLQFPHYSVEQKKLVLDQVRLVLGQIFVHRDLKISDFGPSADPLPFLNEIEKKIETISDYDFQWPSIIFKSL